MSICFDIIPNIVPKRCDLCREKYRMISELKSNDHLKIDGRKVDVFLPGLRNDYQFHYYVVLK